MPQHQFYFQQAIQEAYDKYLQENQGQASLRKFAKLMGLNSGNLSQILRGQRGLRPLNATKVVDNLKLNSFERTRFLRSLAEYKGRNLGAQSQETLLMLKVPDKYLPEIKKLAENFETEVRKFESLDPQGSNVFVALELYSE
jgi:transcriptional regulator with XRE-family HTH domain